MEIKRLSEMYDFQYGTGNDNPDNGGIYPIYGSNGIIGGYDKYNNEDSPVIGHIGANCGCVVYAKGKHYVTYNGVMCKIKDGYDKYFGYYTLLSSGLKNLVLGAAQPFISYNILERIKFNDPGYNEQKKIGELLYKYDKIIDMNEKKIQMLESIADITFKKWFVKFKFDGYDSYKFIEQKPKNWIYGKNNDNLIPAGWHYGSLEEIACFIRGKNITAEKMVEGDYPVISAGLNPSGYHNEYNVMGNSLTISASGANAGFLKYNLENIWAADCSYYNNPKNIWFVYESLKLINEAIRNLQVGAAQPHVYPKNINKLSILIPEEKYIVEYNKKMEPIFEEIGNLKKRNKFLLDQRNLLYPRIIYGKICVI